MNPSDLHIRHSNYAPSAYPTCRCGRWLISMSGGLWCAAHGFRDVDGREIMDVTQNRAGDAPTSRPTASGVEVRMRSDLTATERRFYEKKLALVRDAAAAEKAKMQPGEDGASLNELMRLGREIERYERKLGLR